MLDFLHSIAQKSAAVIVASLAAAFGFFGQSNTIVIAPPPQILFLSAPTSTGLIQQASATISIATEIAASASATSTIQVNSSSSRPQKTEAAKKTKTAEPKPPPTPKTFTARQILDRTGFFIYQRMDGAYRLMLHTTTTASSGSSPEHSRGIDWDLSATSIGGVASTPYITSYVAGSIPKLDTAFSCNPQPDTPPADSPDQNPTFSINTSYTCDISLTDSLLRRESKQISFQTGAGRLTVKTSNLNTVLKFNKSTNGFVLDNQSAAPVTVTGLTFDVSFTALNTSSPVVLRFLEPDNESTLAEYPLQNLPADPVLPYAKKSNDIKASFSFTVKPRGQRLLMVQILGVQPLGIIGVNPEVTVALRQITIDRSDIKTTLLSPIISWSCIPYNPNLAVQSLPTEQNCK